MGKTCKLTYLILVIAGISGCSDSVEERKFSAMPKELEDCRIFFLTNKSGNRLTIARCPNSATTVVAGGKSIKTTLTIDGIEYAPICKNHENTSKHK